MPTRAPHVSPPRPPAPALLRRALLECAAAEKALRTGRTDEGLRRFREAVAMAPTSPDVAIAHGAALREAGRQHDAQRELIRAVSLAPQRADAYAQLGQAFMFVRDFPQAARAFLAAATLQDTNAIAWRNAAEALRQGHQVADGLAVAQRAAALDPDEPSIANTLALLLHRSGRVPEALALCERVHALAPTDLHLSLTFAMLLRSVERHADGWRLHERRLELPELTQRPNPPASPRWEGAPLGGQHLLVRGEQGLGDQVQFVRWAHRLRARGASRITVQCAAPLVRLFHTLEGIDGVIAMADPAPPHDLHVDIMSLPHLLQAGGDMLGECVPYLHAPVTNAALAARLHAAPRHGRMRVGLVWGGTAKHTDDHTRSMPLATLLPVLQREDVQVVVLQQGPSRTQLDALPAHVRSALLDVAEACTDMADTAQVIAACDAVLTVDTSVAHVAGALAVPAWVMVAHPAEWRWGLERADSPYYPQATVLRQRAGGDWSAVVDGALQLVSAWHATPRR